MQYNGDVMNTLNLKSLAAYKAVHGLSDGRKMPVGLMRIASIPDVIRPERFGAVQCAWLSPVVLSPLEEKRYIVRQADAAFSALPTEPLSLR